MIDATGKTILPGLIDCHIHVGTYSEKYYEFDLESVEYATLKGVKDAQAALMAGFTTVRSLGGPGHLELAVRDAINQGMFTGPRMLVAGRCISVTGGMFDNRPPWNHTEQMTGMIADGPVEVLKAVRELVKMGVDVIKYEAGGASPNPYCPPDKATMSLEEMQVIVKEAHRQNKRVAVHTECNSSIIDAALAGADTLEHAIFMNEEAAKIVAAHGCFVMPTVGIGIRRRMKIENHELEDFPPFMIENIKRISSHNVASVKLCKAFGIKVAVGSDMQFGTGIGKNAFELCCYVSHCGFTPMEALLTGTRNAAQALGLEDEIGTIEVGKCADLLVVNQNPLDNIDVLQAPDQLSVIMHNGAVVKN